MNRDNQPWSPAGGARLTWDEHDVPRSAAFDDVYYSRDDGLAESRYVFLHGNALPARFQDASTEGHFCIAETGFGTGLNFLLTWQAWRDSPEPRRPLRYVSIEKHPLTHAELAQALAPWQSLAQLAQDLAENYPPLVPGTHRLLFDAGRVTLDLWFEDAAATLDDLALRGTPLVDAWYLDGFAPARNAAMWQSGLLSRLGELSRTNATFSTFTAVGQVRRDLTDAGFDVSKRAGYGTKRECLQGQLARRPATGAAPDMTPWDIPGERAAPTATALVLGAGLAGCFTAAALAARGVHVTLLDAGAAAGGASGNDQGVLFTRLSHRHSTLVDFALQSYVHAAARYRGMFHSGALRSGLDGELCGSFQQVADAQELERLKAALHGADALAEVLDAAAASERTGVLQAHGGTWLPASGWLHPPAVCTALLDHPLITLREHCGPLTLEHANGLWHAGA
ncbi:MAG: tRNA (5-methylaminomethyl-2-thiouridine)(34)-methyltransferase MnmD, partial [Halioglobus sp.]|nr:tRNA (5-methylaminomethyl-2-thiouridine)(34)-methyltransferase MnmD [Halioglobus sp.]